jgi:hypothetical protein
MPRFAGEVFRFGTAMELLHSNNGQKPGMPWLEGPVIPDHGLKVGVPIHVRLAFDQRRRPTFL